MRECACLECVSKKTEGLFLRDLIFDFGDGPRGIAHTSRAAECATQPRILMKFDGEATHGSSLHSAHP